jgi:hypothetical protein
MIYFLNTKYICKLGDSVYKSRFHIGTSKILISQMQGFRNRPQVHTDEHQIFSG